MADLVFVHLTNPSIYPDDQFSYLESRLLDHVNFDFNCTLPQEASPRIVHLLFTFENDEYVMKLSVPVQYQGADINFATLCREQRMSFQSMDEMKQVIRSMDLEPHNAQSSADSQIATAAAAGRLSARKPATDRSMISVSRDTRRHINAAQLASDIRESVSGQDQAVEEVAHWAAMSAGKINPSRPVCILLAGETGVGKTFLARNLDRAMNRQIINEQEKYGDIVVRCNELYEDHMVARLTGAPAGYIGYNDSTILSPVAANPNQVIIFDEIEKASPKVLDVLMSAMDTGEVTLNKPVDGHDTLDLKHAILLFTTNIPLDNPRGKNVMGFRAAETATICESPWEQMERYCDALVSAGIRREIAARFTSIIKFKTLSSDSVIDIILKAIQDCADEYNLLISYVEPSIVQAIYDRIGETKFGARVAINHVERALGLLFADCSLQEAEGGLDLVGSLEEPRLLAHRKAVTSQPPIAEHPMDECCFGENDPDDEPVWEKDA